MFRICSKKGKNLKEIWFSLFLELSRNKIIEDIL